MNSTTMAQQAQQGTPTHSTINQQQYTPLTLETRTAIPTNVAAFHLNRKEQTLRAWSSQDSGPIRPTHINGRLAWPVADIKRLLGV